MKKSELLKIAKPILFNAEMVLAILDGRKTETRRAVKDAPNDTYRVRCVDIYGDGTIWAWDFFYGSPLSATRYITIKQPYQVRDYLYVRETYGIYSRTYGMMPKLYYKADGDAPEKIKWTPSIHMTKEAARIFLRVTDVRTERLQEITMSGMQAEGVIPENVTGGQWQQWQNDYMKPVWESTVKAKERRQYGWDADPWVWVIAFERITPE